MQNTESHSFALVDAAIHWCIVKLPGHEEMLLERPNAQLGHWLHQKRALTGAEVEDTAGCYIDAHVCSLGHEQLPSAFPGATLHLEAKPASPEDVIVEVSAMQRKYAAQTSQSAGGFVLAVAVLAQRLSELVPGCVAA